MKNFWKLIVFACLFLQSSYAFDAIQYSESSLQKKDNRTIFDKENLGIPNFVQFSIERGTSDLKNNNRIPVGFGNYFPAEFQSLHALNDNNSKIVLSNQDVDRYNSVSILLFPFHYFW
ncbi:hypothetical protein [Flavobacterium aestuarii]|uniref:hypothetical protein n=1 Tax=Flavobacterium aestuarii TaxID=3149227 RepID=UPI0032B4D6A9